MSVDSLKLKSSSSLQCDLLVLGASFTGVEVLHQLRRRNALAAFDTIVVDARSEHGYIPLAHEVVASTVDRENYVLPTAAYVRSLPRCTYVVDTVVAVDADEREVTLTSGRVVRARAIVVALGSRVEAPASIGGALAVPSAKFLEQCEDIRRRLQASLPGRITVIGGGITGVEMAGELALWCKRAANGFHVTLLETRDQLLFTAGNTASGAAAKLLRRLGVELLFDVQVVKVDAHCVTIARKTTDANQPATSELTTTLVVWAGGVRPATTDMALGVHRGEDGWIEVDTSLQCRNPEGVLLPGIFAGGDAVRVCDASGRWPTMQRAIECIWQGKILARNVTAFLSASQLSAVAPPTTGLVQHTLIRDFPYGISIGSHSLVLYGRMVVNLRAFGVAFRRWLMRRYFARYRVRGG